MLFERELFKVVILVMC
uniref:BLTX281 n=1 Tax=Nephila pilipes TaxID=299642 RepID=A0A076KTR4_NEPPI|nr:BLTX281 [Nephila pilipes]